MIPILYPPRWDCWTFGLRWSRQMGFFAIDLGPWCLVWEWDVRE